MELEPLNKVQTSPTAPPGDWKQLGNEHNEVADHRNKPLAPSIQMKGLNIQHRRATAG
jgi:hypothetical protein